MKSLRGINRKGVHIVGHEYLAASLFFLNFSVIIDQIKMIETLGKLFTRSPEVAVLVFKNKKLLGAILLLKSLEQLMQKTPISWGLNIWVRHYFFFIFRLLWI